MGKEKITGRQAICILITYIFGSSGVIGISEDAKQDSWASLLLAAVLALPVLMIYARIIRLYPGDTLMTAIMKIFGKFSGRVIVLLLTLYALNLSSFILRYYSEYLKVITMTETPQLPLMLIMVLAAVYLARSSQTTIAKFSVTIVPIFYFIASVTTILLSKDIELSNFQPVFASGINNIFTGSYRVFTFPLVETLLVLGLTDSLPKNLNPYKMFSFGMLFAVMLMLIVVFRNIGVLGPALASAEYFPSYSSVRLINVGDFLSRIEGTISANFVLAGITKIAVCLIFASKGLACLFDIADYKTLVLPTALFIVALSPMWFESLMEMFQFMGYNQIYAIPFQIVLPVIIWVTAEVKNYKKKHPEGLLP